MKFAKVIEALKEPNPQRVQTTSSKIRAPMVRTHKYHI